MPEHIPPATETEDRLGMTAEQWERFQTYTHGFGEQDEHGIDVSLLRENLRHTPEQRVRRMFAWMAAERGCRLEDLEFQFHPRLRGAEEGLPFRWDARTLAAGLNFTLVTDLGAVDFLGEAPGAAPFEEMWERSVETELFGATVRVVSLDDLIAMKRATGRDKDRDHLRELERLRSMQRVTASDAL